MKTIERVQDIQERFDVNHIYAYNFLDIKPVGNYYQDIEILIKNKPKPFVKWVGGKRQLLKQFKKQKLYPPTGFNPLQNSFFEPFVGGGAVFFDLLPKKAYLSDLNFELTTTYNVIKTDVKSLISSLKKCKYEKDEFLRVRSQKVSDLSPLQVATRFIYLNRTCFNGMYRVNSKGGFNVPFGKYTNPLICDEENLRKVSKVLQNVEIKHQDYKEVLKKAKKGDFIYFDPPYHPVSKTSSFTSYTKEDFNELNQIELRDTFKTLHERGCYLMLSNSDTPLINQIYSNIKGVKINKVDAGRALNSNSEKRGKIKEVLITNY